MSEQQKLRHLGQCGAVGDGHDATRIWALHESGCWDLMSMEERRQWFYAGRVFDTPGGRAFAHWMNTNVQQGTPHEVTTN